MCMSGIQQLLGGTLAELAEAASAFRGISMSENIHEPNLREICTSSIQQFIGGTLAELAEEIL